MKVYIREIPSQGLELNGSISNELIDESDYDLKFVGPIALKLRADKKGQDIDVRVNAKGRILTFCSRCLEDVEQDYDKGFDLDYQIADKETDFIDMTDDIRQEIFLSLMPKVLCDQNCKGLCPNCGSNLNKEKCKCK